MCVFYTVSYMRAFFFFNDTATTEIYTLSLHDALPISCKQTLRGGLRGHPPTHGLAASQQRKPGRSEEHTSELQSQSNLVCRLLLEKKKLRSRAIPHDHRHRHRHQPADPRYPAPRRHDV